MATARPIGFFPATIDTGQAQGLSIDKGDTVSPFVSGGAPEFQPRSLGGALATATIQDLGHGVVLVRPLHISIEEIQDETFATSTDLGLIGRGETSFDAIDDLREQVSELFESLREMRATLGRKLRDQLAFLERLAQG